MIIKRFLIGNQAPSTSRVESGWSGVKTDAFLFTPRFPIYERLFYLEHLFQPQPVDTARQTERPFILNLQLDGMLHWFYQQTVELSQMFFFLSV